jgi:hypothetical protein
MVVKAIVASTVMATRRRPAVVSPRTEVWVQRNRDAHGVHDRDGHGGNHSDLRTSQQRLPSEPQLRPGQSGQSPDEQQQQSRQRAGHHVRASRPQMDPRVGRCQHDQDNCDRDRRGHAASVAQRRGGRLTRAE